MMLDWVNRRATGRLLQVLVFTRLKERWETEFDTARRSRKLFEKS